MRGGEPILIENTLFGVRDKVQIAIDRIKQFEPPEGYWFADSYGKDSSVVRKLFTMSQVKFEPHHSHTTLDHINLLDLAVSIILTLLLIIRQKQLGNYFPQEDCQQDKKDFALFLKNVVEGEGL